jgi:transglutaminase-like putative cysteine protease
MKKIIFIILIILLISSPVYGYDITSKTGEFNSWIEDKDETGMLFLVFTTQSYFLNIFDVEIKTVEATVVVNSSNVAYDHIKIVIEKDEQEYIYSIVEDVESFPLQMGTGQYKVSLLGSNDGRRYRQLSVKTFDVELEENAVFLSASQTVNWTLESEAAILAAVLTEKAENDKEKLEMIHDYIVHNVTYDYQKAATMKKGYIPNPDRTLEEEEGICYDFSALLASMMRSVEVPAKLIKGYSTFTPVYHAWNEVLIDDEWYIIDASTDSIFVEYRARYTLRKNDYDYQTSKEY